ncbi:hypothetical protein EW026_g7202 [Hermanssonia centrifuga]|uniref:Fumarylacetoacetase-like C-terminal domain-containing protein n=1 Tax=Hermanssonia centrifuga TaxID=98765 RepID=A0A4S4KD16_9APHY|nr:hypothetical protein EW026_g7202 [Hermanssonia centrifuga]
MAAAAFVKHGKKASRNYADHIKELNNAVPKEPFFFLKPTTSYLLTGEKVEIPRGITAHHEVELGLVIGKRGRDITQADAHSYIAGYALAVDMTARNLQNEVKKKGLPWSAVKGFDTFTPVSAIKQKGNTSDMIFSIPRLIEHISSIMTLEEGDLVLTGTPSGIGPIVEGDKVECLLSDPTSGKILASLNFGAVNRVAGYRYNP